jgi:hypothetical protein
MKLNNGRFAIAICCGLMAGVAVADDDFRCGGSIVKTGMTQAAVLEACGEPASRAVEKVDVRSGKQVVGQTQVSRWTYVTSGTTRVLTFDQETLKSIE